MRPSALTRRASTISSASGARRSPSSARSASGEREDALDVGLGRAGRTMPGRGLPPSSRSIAWASTVLPAPVSPVRAFRPGPRRSSARSISSRFSTRSSWSIERRSTKRSGRIGRVVRSLWRFGWRSVRRRGGGATSTAASEGSRVRWRVCGIEPNNVNSDSRHPAGLTPTQPPLTFAGAPQPPAPYFANRPNRSRSRW